LVPIKLPDPLNPGSVQIWIADLQTWKNYATPMRLLLSKQEQDRLERYKIPIKKQEFLSSRGILKFILSKYTGIPPEHVQLEISPDGKPFLPGSQIQFNISHSAEKLICVLCLDNLIGVDIQEIYPITGSDHIIQTFFSPAEVQYLSSAAAQQRNQELFFAIWTAKEAYLKAVGSGIRRSFNQLSIIPEGEDLRSFQLQIPDSKEREAGWTIISLEVGENYSAALAYQGLISERQHYQITPEDIFLI
jgi:4'-phosphopantetheinyl transferase